MKPKILVVDDDTAILSLLATYLEQEGYDVECCTTAKTFREAFHREDFDLFLVDVSLPDGNGFGLVKELRLRTEQGIIILTGRHSETDQVVGLEIGADDYVTKPFRLRELAARVNAVHRRASRNPVLAAVSPQSMPERRISPETGPQVDFEFDGYTVSSGARRIWSPAGKEIMLTTAEFDLLIALLRRRGHVFDREQLMNAVKGRDWESYDRAVDGLVSRLRRKIPAPNAASHYVRTVHGIGYTFTG